MGTERADRLAASGLPDLLTVEEVALLLRLSRGKAYDLTRQWRATGGQSGLPVVDFGDALRVPRRALERMLGVELTGPLPVRPKGAPKLRAGAERPVPKDGVRGGARAEPVAPATGAGSNVTPMRRSGKRPAGDQAELFDPTSEIADGQ